MENMMKSTCGELNLLMKNAARRRFTQEIAAPKLVKTTEFKSNQHELLHITAESLVEGSNKSPEDCKDALE
ncbi:hypothetical protein SDJN02_20621, partial [Cucurbita argyrosperma subsp. argyrosperma]